jgi:hypothetical protein
LMSFTDHDVYLHALFCCWLVLIHSFSVCPV